MVLYPEIEITVKLLTVTGNHEKDRNDLRTMFIDKIVREKPGTGTKEKTSKYIYIVEKNKSGNRIYLTRPVPLNKGFDFVIHVENQKFMNYKDNPKHEDILKDLSLKKEDNINNYNNLLQLIEQVFLCYDPEDLIISNVNLPNNIGYSNELILKVIKWFFIEQDIRYWNWSGRKMLMNSIKGI